jgi:hypothetical protein
LSLFFACRGLFRGDLLISSARLGTDRQSRPAHLRIDDPTIPDTLIVWRTLDPLETRIDPTTGQREIMSSVFRSEEMCRIVFRRLTWCARRREHVAPLSILVRFWTPGVASSPSDAHARANRAGKLSLTWVFSS